MRVSTKSITQEELEEKKAAAEESHELVEGTKIKVLKANVGKSGVNVEYWKTAVRYFPNKDGELELISFENGGKEAIPFLPHPDLILAF